MFETVTVDQALAKGKRMVNYPVFGIMIGMFVITSFLLSEKIIPVWGFPIAFVVGIGLSWLWWSFMITRWRLWAFENVRNVHELKERAIQEKLIWNDGSIFEKTEIRSAAAREKWALLEEKFKVEDLFLDDLSIANETIIYYSRRNSLIAMAIALVGMGMGIYVMLWSDTYLLGLFMAVICAYSSFKSYQRASNTKAQIIISNKGIETTSTRFYSWDDIQCEYVSGAGSNSDYYLRYDHPDGSERVKIDDLDISHSKLSSLLILYRGRFERNKTRDLPGLD
jgi:hypothetical protein